MIHKPQYCERCNSTNIKLRRALLINGVSRIAWWCMSCERWAIHLGPAIPHTDVTAFMAQYGSTIEDIPIVRDDSMECPCVICGKPGEWHHWAPQSMGNAFGADHIRWPGAFLCIYHHHLWHDIVTPGLLWKRTP